jgi:hypothetical protein
MRRALTLAPTSSYISADKVCSHNGLIVFMQIDFLLNDQFNLRDLYNIIGKKPSYILLF